MTESASHIDTDPVERMTCKKCQAVLDVSGLSSFDDIICPQCQTEQTVPAELGGFRLLRLLGQGGMGAVYQGVDTALDRPVAVKVLLRSVGDDAEFVQTFQKEAKAAAALNHPNIVQIYQFGREKGQPYIAMELLQGGRLDKMIATGDPLDPRLIVKVAIDVAEGLKAAGSIGLVHGDIKPENILMDSNGTAKVVDFGLAAFMNRESGREGIWGTPYYIAPEKVRGKSGDQRSDIYSLGATIFHSLTLRPPFEGKTAVDVIKARLHDPAPSVSDLRPDVHAEVVRVVQRMLEADPARRYPTYVSLLADLRKVEAAIGPPRTLTRLNRTSGKITISKSGAGRGSGAATRTSGASLSGSLPSVSAPKPKRNLAKPILIIVLLGLIIAGAGAGWWAWQDYQARKRAELRQAQVVRIAEQARDEFTALDESIDSVYRRLVDSYPVLHATTNRLGMAEGTLRQADSAVELSTMVPDLVRLPERMLAALEEAELAINRMRDRLTVIVRRREDIRTSDDPAAARKHLEAVRRAVAEADEDRQRALERIEAVGAMERELTVLDEQIAEYQVRMADEEQQRLEDERRRRELTSQREAEEAEHRRLAEQEKADREAIAAAQREVIPLMRQNQFADGLTRVREMRETMVSDAGKAKVDLWIERLTLLPDLKATIIEQLNRAVYPWGWLGRLDIVGADEETVHLTNRRVTWDEVPPGQMLRFIDRYGDADTLDRAQRSLFNLAAAVYCYENNALPKAREYAQKAVGDQRRLRERIETLMPDLGD